MTVLVAFLVFALLSNDLVTGQFDPPRGPNRPDYFDFRQYASTTEEPFFQTITTPRPDLQTPSLTPITRRRFTLGFYDYDTTTGFPIPETTPEIKPTTPATTATTTTTPYTTPDFITEIVTYWPWSRSTVTRSTKAPVDYYTSEATTEIPMTTTQPEATTEDVSDCVRRGYNCQTISPPKRCWVGSPKINPERFAKLRSGAKLANLFLLTGQPITCDGIIRVWQFVPTRSELRSRVVFAVFRPTFDSQRYQYVDSVAVDRLDCRPNEWNTWEAPKSISVQTGDVVGVFQISRYIILPAAVGSRTNYENMRFYIESANSTLDEIRRSGGIVEVSPTWGVEMIVPVIAQVEEIIEIFTTEEFTTTTEKFEWTTRRATEPANSCVNEGDCEVVEKLPSCSVGADKIDPVRYSGFRGVDTSNLTLLTGMPIRCSGVLDSWDFVPTTKTIRRKIAFAVFRPDSRVSPYYRLVDINRPFNNYFTPFQWNRFTPRRRISVMPGDIIGLFQSRSDFLNLAPLGVVGNRLKECENFTFQVMTFELTHGNLTQVFGGVIDLSQDHWRSEVMVPLIANIEPEPTPATKPLDACDVGAPEIDASRYSDTDVRLVIFPYLNFLCSGQITKWEFVKTHQDISLLTFAVFTPLPEHNFLTYRLVGFNTIPGSGRQFQQGEWNTFSNLQYRITVKTGDVIGMFFRLPSNQRIKVARPRSDEDGMPYGAVTSRYSADEIIKNLNITDRIIDFSNIGRYETAFGMPSIRAHVNAKTEPTTPQPQMPKPPRRPSQYSNVFPRVSASPDPAFSSLRCNATVGETDNTRVQSSNYCRVERFERWFYTPDDHSCSLYYPYYCVRYSGVLDEEQMHLNNFETVNQCIQVCGNVRHDVHLIVIRSGGY